MEIADDGDPASQFEGSTQVELVDLSSPKESSPKSTHVTTGATHQYQSAESDSDHEERRPLQQSGPPGSATPTIIPKNRRRPGSSSDGSKMTMTGTVMQGSGGGQPIEVEVKLSQREFQRLTSRESHKQKKEPCTYGRKQGPHIILLSLLCIPVAFVISLCLSFYNGAITWYNMFIYYSEEKSIIYRLTLCPLLILSFPLTVGFSTLCLAVVASVLQVSWLWSRWKVEILDGEKGFYGWFCNKIQLPDCSPYQVVVLEENAVF